MLDEAIDAAHAIEHELEQLASQPKDESLPNKPRRAPLPPNLLRVQNRHEPTSTTSPSTLGWLLGEYARLRLSRAPNLSPQGSLVGQHAPAVLEYYPEAG